jgi:hypothetical protein
MSHHIRTALLWAIPIFSFGLCGHSLAGGTVSLDDLPVTRSSSKLSEEIDSELARSNLQAPQVTCTANRLGRQWAKLGGARIGPYSCPIGRKVLEITTTPVFLDDAGSKLNMNERRLQGRAAKVQEQDLNWKWSDCDDPAQQCPK